MPLHKNIELIGDLDNYRIEGDEEHAMNEIYDRITNRGIDFLGSLNPDARIEDVDGLMHFTLHWENRTKTCTVFFIAGNSTGEWQMQIYAYGRHHGDDNKAYDLYTFKNGKRTRTYSFR